MEAHPGLYLMQDGTYADPSQCSKGKDGRLRHKENDVGVVLKENGEPFTLADATELNVKAANAGKVPGTLTNAPVGILTTADMKPKVT